MANPIVGREWMSMTRSRLTLALALGFLAVLAVLIWLLWPAEGVFSLAAQTSRALVLSFTITLVLLVMLYAPAFSSTSIVGEKENNSYDLLFASLLRPWQIITGKLVAATLLLSVFILLSLPFFAACFFLGAVSGAETARIYAVVAATAVLAGLIGLVISSRARDAHRALISTYLVLILLSGLPWLPYILLRNHPVWGAAAYALRAVSPLTAMASILLPGFDIAAAGGAAEQPAWLLYLVFAALLSTGAFGFLIVNIYGFGRGGATVSRQVIDDRRELVRRKLRFPFYLIDPQRRRRPLSPWINPIFAREMRSQAFGGGVWVFRGIYLCLAASALLMVLLISQTAEIPPDMLKSAALAFQLGLIILLVPSLTSGAVTRELENNSLDGLRMARIGAPRFLAGKLQTALLFVLFLVVGSAPLWLVIVYMGLNTAGQLLIAWGIIATTILMALSAGLCASAFARRTSTAAATAYGGVFVLTLGSLFPYLAPGRFIPAVQDALLSLNPFVASLYVLQTEETAVDPGLWRRHLLTMGAVCFLLLAAAVVRVGRRFARGGSE